MASIGIGIALGGSQNGISFQLGASAAKGKADGQDTAWEHTQIHAGDTVQLTSGGDTTLAGARIEGERVIADVGGDLHIESLQDTGTYDSKQKNAGFSLSLCIPPLCVGAPVSGNLSAGQSKIDSNYMSVTERSGIEAGDGGFQVNVGGDTTLIGAAIASTQQAIDDGKNHFRTGGELALVDLKNHAEYEAEAVSVNIGTGLGTDGQLKPQGTSAGHGEDSGEAQSVTSAGISGIAGDTDARTGDAPTGIDRIFDADKVQKEIDAQVLITQVFGQLASKATGDYAEARLKEASALRDQAIVSAGKALFGNEQAREEVKQGAGAAWEYIKEPDNWPYLIGVMTPEEKEKLAQAYEVGDSRTIGLMMGEAFANLPIGGGGLGTIKRVDKVIDGAKDATKITKTGSGSANVAHTIDADYSLRYVPSPKHRPESGWGTPMALPDSVAQEVLSRSTLVGKQRYGLWDGKIYEFQPDNAGGWHGYPIPGTEAPPSFIRELRNSGQISNAEYGKLLRGK